MSISGVPASRTRRLSDHERLKLCIESIRDRSAQAVPWGPETVGIPPRAAQNALVQISSVAFYANAREEVAAFAEVCLNLLELHRPREAGALDGAGATVHRCRSCMLRWPCPTFRGLSRLLD